MGHAEGSLPVVADPYNLRRFVDAQSEVYPEVRRELRDGSKRTHWMWFVFPQLKGLGRTGTAEHFGIASLAEAQAYLAHPVLGPRLRECAALLRDYPGLRPIALILGATDALKLRSSMTLFLQAGAEADRQLFQAVLDRFYDGAPDQRTQAMLRQ
jgi:uncharacterized protein (DUF1810 family)